MAVGSSGLREAWGLGGGQAWLEWKSCSSTVRWSGPATWGGVADALSAAGHDVAIADLRAAAVTGDPGAFIDSAVSSIPPAWSQPVVVGHSGAGFFLPSIAERLDASRSVFVDAGLPPDRGPATPGGDFVDHLRTLAVHGVLPRWSTWWGDETMRTLVPDVELCARVVAELPEVPLEFYERPVDLPAGWQQRPSSLILSQRGLPRRCRPGEIVRVARHGTPRRTPRHRDQAASHRRIHRRTQSSDHL